MRSGVRSSALEQIFAATAALHRVIPPALDATQAVYHYTPAQSAQLAGLALPEVLGAPLAAALQRGDIADFTARRVHSLDGRAMRALHYCRAWRYHFSSWDAPTPRRVAPHRRRRVESIARAAVLTGLLDDDAPPVLLAPGLANSRRRSLRRGLDRAADDPPTSAFPITRRYIAATILDNAVGDAIDPILDAQVWPSLVAPVLSIGPLLDPIAPTLTLSVNPRTIDLGQSSEINASATDNRGVANLVVTAAGESLTLVDGRNTYTPTRAGVIPIVARARDAAGNLTERREDLLVRTPGDNAPPVVEIASPLDNAEVTQPTDSIGSVSDASLRSWCWRSPGNSPNATPVILAQGDQAISNGVLGKVDPTLIFNGVYIVILQAEDANGLKSQDSIQVRINGDMKVGHFRISFEEIEIPLQGIPIRITRTYDTRQAGESLDFGHGWSIDYQNVRIRESRKLGFSWRLAQQGGGFSPFCVRPSGTPMVTITLPKRDRKVHASGSRSAAVASR